MDFSDQSLGYEVDFLPVGSGRSGDAIAVRFGNLFGRRDEQVVVVIDGGFTDTGDAMVDHLSTHFGTDRVDLVISTHPDMDHAAGLAVVLEKCKVGKLWMHLPWKHTDDIAKMFVDGRVTDTSVRDSLRRSLESVRSLESIAHRKGIPIVEPLAGLADDSGHVVAIGPSLDYYESLLPLFRGTPMAKSTGLFGGLVKRMEEAIKYVAESWHIETLSDNGDPTSAENNSSVITVIVLGNRWLMFTGDAGIPALTGAADYVASRGLNFSPLTFIQVPHHGSRRNVGPTILDRIVGPRLSQEAVLKTALVSVAPDCAPKHPAKKVMNAFKRRGAPVHITAGMGKNHFKNAPDRGWSASVPEPLHTIVDE